MGVYVIFLQAEDATSGLSLCSLFLPVFPMSACLPTPCKLLIEVVEKLPQILLNMRISQVKIHI